MRILLTGSSGFVGTAVAARLASGGHEVVALNRRNRPSETPGSAVAADIAQDGLARRLDSKVGRCDAIVHAAAALSSFPYETDLSTTNGAGTQQLLELAQMWQVSKFVYLSSLPVIGVPSELPVSEDHPVHPPSAYHASKLYGEHLAAVCGRLGTPTLSLRLTSPVGARMPEHRILPVFVRRALTGAPLEILGSGRRGQDYVDVRDVALAVHEALDSPATGLLNIASGRCISNLELARLCVGLLGSSSEVQLTGQPDPEEEISWEVSIARAANEIGYRPQHALEDSIASVAGALQTGRDG